MNRRGFLSALAGIAAGAAYDPERLLWIPGRKLISIPKPPPRLEVMALWEMIKRFPIPQNAIVFIPFDEPTSQSVFTNCRHQVGYELEI